MWSKLIKGYLRRIWKVFLWCAVAAFFFCIVFFLYDLPLEAVGYATILCVVPGALLLTFDFARYVSHHKMIERIYSVPEHPIPERLPEAMDLLEEDYQELVHALYRDKLEMQSSLEAAYAELIDYFTAWTHQIKTPISAMNLLLQSEDTKENREMAAELFKIEQYTNMALQYLRLGSSTNDFLLQPYALDDMIRQAVRKYAKLFISSKIALDYQETGITLITDEKWMVFVIEQILSNALKYTKKGKISIYASGNDCFVIEDTGIGISAEDLPRVFEKGYTGYNGRMDKKATGLGLYLCRQILNKLGHKIEIFSKPDEGTRVCITVRKENNAILQNGKVFD